jgi:beta-lactam-binding protein with PASTA domain
MPNLLPNGGMDKETAAQILERNGFKNVRWVGVESERKPGTVLSQSVAAYRKIDVTTELVIEYSNGKPTEPTIPPENLITKSCTFELPVLENVFRLRIESNGKAVLPDTWIVADAGSITLELQGSGVEFYTLYINGEFYKTVTVDFVANE